MDNPLPPHPPSSSPSPRRLLIMINPASGSGRALSIFHRDVYPLLAEAGISMKVFVTSSSGSASDFIKEVDLDLYDGLVIISGDGLVYEVVNGIMRRSDREDVLKIPLGIIPGGSGNGLAFSINYAVGDHQFKNPILTSIQNVVGGRRTPLDLVEVRTKSGIYHSILSVGWGLLADIDIESESLRFLGGFRFTVWGVVRTLGLRRYRGRLSFLPYQQGWASKRPNSFLSDEGDNEVKKDVDVLEETTTKVQQDLQQPYIPDLSDPVPTSWTTIEDDFIMVYSGNVTHMAADCFLAPSSRLDDGVMWLLFLRGKNISRRRAAQFLLALNHGKHVDLPYVTLIPVQAFRLESLAGREEEETRCPRGGVRKRKSGVMTIDGELVDTDIIQAHILPSCLTVMSK